MANSPGHIELERSLDSITVGRRHRTDLGDLDAMIESIRREGLLQPITITPEGALVCGARRLSALQALGIKTVNVWVRSGITDRLGQLLAEQDDNALHKPLTPTEQATLYRELKTVMAEDAARRQVDSRFVAGGHNPRVDGGAKLAPPSESAGKARAQAALMVTGRNAYTTLERVGRLQDLAGDASQPEHVRAAASAELERIDAGAGVYSAFQRVNAEATLTELEQLAVNPDASPAEQAHARAEAARVRAEEPTVRAADLERLAADALARVRASGKKPRGKTPLVLPGGWERRTLRAFVLTWTDLIEWWEHFDVEEIAAGLTDEQWEQFTATVAGTVAFAEAIEVARQDSSRRTA
ncbi:ParB N-terminal domain-containing protein [Glaciibacter superstes]|uniref:ParB N-terminal domain-containing protein n=1 Tax=Glaciibacter superstes TaxID=501023 RepID=UPI0003B3121B|nr:ParB/RepB/Spo0J family partition protein [Glaciibacter superstes]